MNMTKHVKVYHIHPDPQGLVERGTIQLLVLKYDKRECPSTNQTACFEIELISIIESLNYPPVPYIRRC